MRLPFASLLVLLPTFALACSPAAPDFSWDDQQTRTSTSYPSEPARTAPPSPPSPPRTAPPAVTTEVEPVVAAHAEVVEVYMRDRMNGLWFCTGTLVSPTAVVTAAHCLDTVKMKSWQIYAPLAPNRPTVNGLAPASLSTAFDEVANHDLGILELAAPVTLPRYAELTDVGARVDAGEALEVGAIVRNDEVPGAPFMSVPFMPLSSTVAYGYEHGFGVPLYSKGGDSGSGLFLVENGELTHKLVAVARQPEPSRGIDHSSRIDAPFLDWAAGQL